MKTVVARDALEQELHSQIITPADAEYDSARQMPSSTLARRSGSSMRPRKRTAWRRR